MAVQSSVRRGRLADDPPSSLSRRVSANDASASQHRPARRCAPGKETVSPVVRKPATIRLENFDGTNQPIASFIASGDREREGGGSDDRRRARFVKQEQRGGPPPYDQRFRFFSREIGSCRQQLQQLQSNGFAAGSPSVYASGSMRYSFPVDGQQLQQQMPMQPWSMPFVSSVGLPSSMPSSYVGAPVGQPPSGHVQFPVPAAVSFQQQPLPPTSSTVFGRGRGRRGPCFVCAGPHLMRYCPTRAAHSSSSQAEQTEPTSTSA